MNFGEFLIDRQGKAAARFEPTIKPDGPELVGALEKALAEKPKP